MPSDCEVTVALDARVGRLERLERPAAVGELDAEHAAHQASATAGRRDEASAMPVMGPSACGARPR